MVSPTFDKSVRQQGQAVSFTQNITTAQANEIIFIVMGYNPNYALSSPASTPALTWIDVATQTNSQSGLRIWYAIAATAQQYAVTAGYSSATNNLDIIVAAWQGESTSSPLDGSAVTTVNNSSTNSIPTASITTTLLNDTLIVFTSSGSGTNQTAGTGFTLDQHGAFFGSTADEYQYVTTPNTFTAAFGTASNYWNLVAVALAVGGVASNVTASGGGSASATYLFTGISGLGAVGGRASASVQIVNPVQTTPIIQLASDLIGIPNDYTSESVYGTNVVGMRIQCKASPSLVGFQILYYGNGSNISPPITVSLYGDSGAQPISLPTTSIEAQTFTPTTTISWQGPISFTSTLTQGGYYWLVFSCPTATLPSGHIVAVGNYFYTTDGIAFTSSNLGSTPLSNCRWGTILQLDDANGNPVTIFPIRASTPNQTVLNQTFTPSSNISVDNVWLFTQDRSWDSSPLTLSIAQGSTIFGRTAIARIYQTYPSGSPNYLWIAGSETPTTVGNALKSLTPSYVQGLIRVQPFPSIGYIIPLYTYPTDGTWATLIAMAETYPALKIIAIINPNSGPGVSSDPNYVTGINNLRAVGITVAGYVYTSYGARSQIAVQTDMSSYKSWYNINAILFDEFANTTGFESYYSSLTAYANSLGFPTTIGGAGTTVPNSYIGTVSILNIYENSGLPSPGSIQIATSGGSYSNFSLIAYNVLGSSLSQSVINTYVSSVGWIGFTDAPNGPVPPGNPYNVLPSYLSTLLGYINGSSSNSLPSQVIADYNTVRAAVLTTSSKCKFDVAIRTDQYASASQIDSDMVSLAGQLTFDIFWMNSACNASSAILQQAIITAHSLGKLIIADCANPSNGSNPLATMVNGFDAIASTIASAVPVINADLGAQTNPGPVLSNSLLTQLQAFHVPLLLHVDNFDPDRTIFNSTFTQAQRIQWFTTAAALQIPIGFLLMYNVFFPEYPINTDYDAVTDGTMPTILGLMNTVPNPIATSTITESYEHGMGSDCWTPYPLNTTANLNAGVSYTVSMSGGVVPQNAFGVIPNPSTSGFQGFSQYYTFILTRGKIPQYSFDYASLHIADVITQTNFLAVRFLNNSTSTLVGVDANVQAFTGGATLTAALWTDNGGNDQASAPSTVVAGSQITSSVISATGWVTLNFPVGLNLSSNTYYWIVFNSNSSITLTRLVNPYYFKVLYWNGSVWGVPPQGPSDLAVRVVTSNAEYRRMNDILQYYNATPSLWFAQSFTASTNTTLAGIALDMASGASAGNGGYTDTTLSLYRDIGGKPNVSGGAIATGKISETEFGIESLTIGQFANPINIVEGQRYWFAVYPSNTQVGANATTQIFLRGMRLGYETDGYGGGAEQVLQSADHGLTWTKPLAGRTLFTTFAVIQAPNVTPPVPTGNVFGDICLAHGVSNYFFNDYNDSILGTAQVYAGGQTVADITSTLQNVYIPLGFRASAWHDEPPISGSINSSRINLSTAISQTNGFVLGCPAPGWGYDPIGWSYNLASTYPYYQDYMYVQSLARLSQNCSIGQTAIFVNNDYRLDNFAQGQSITIDTTGSNPETNVISAIIPGSSTTQFSLQNPLSYNHTATARVINGLYKLYPASGIEPNPPASYLSVCADNTSILQTAFNQAYQNVDNQIGLANLLYFSGWVLADHGFSTDNVATQDAGHNINSYIRFTATSWYLNSVNH